MLNSRSLNRSYCKIYMVFKVDRISLFPEALVSNASSKINLDVEMETGTGKTYCYIKTILR